MGLQLYVFPFHLSESHPCFLHQPPPTLHHHHHQLQLYAALHLQHQWNGGRHRPGWCGEYQRVNQDRPPGPVVSFAPSSAPFLCTECCSRFAFLGVSRSPFVDFIYYFICILSFVLRVWQQMCFFLGTG